MYFVYVLPSFNHKTTRKINILFSKQFMEEKKNDIQNELSWPN